MPSSHRLLALFGAIVGWFGLLLQLYLTIALKRIAGEGLGAALWLYLGYFTILSNILAAMALTACALRSRSGPMAIFQRPGTWTCVTMSMLVVGLVYNVMLRGLWHPQGLQILGDNIVHVAMPAWILLYWWLAVPKATLRWPHVWIWLVYPAVYFAYALLRGAWDGWYPYPFLDVKAIGYGQVFIDALVVLSAFLVIGLGLIALGRWQIGKYAIPHT
ncbi:Pr6Pr family membrane protein [Dyella sp.]|uniref:Pr6Pr family membrane protein n=1 Tax=Dyella sp. TaxID=1869338 RepID=UPI002ED46AF6